MPITGPLTFLSPPSELYRTNEEAYGERRRFDERVAEDEARGSYQESVNNDPFIGMQETYSSR